MLAAAQKISRMHGLVQSYDPNTYSVKVALQPSGTLTGWIPIETHAIGNGWGVAYGPAVGDQAVIDFAEGDPESAAVSGFIYSDQDRPPPVPSGELWTVHKSGGYLKFTNDGNVSLNTVGSLNATVGGNMTANVAGNANTNAAQANVTATSSASVTAPTIKLGASGQTLLQFVTSAFVNLFNTHTHPEHDGGNTSAPNQTMGSSHLTSTITGG